MAASVENVVGIEDALRHLDAAGLELGNELRPDAGGDVAAVDAALAVGRFAAEAEDLLHGDHVALHAGDFLQADEASPTVAHALDLDDDVQGRGDLRAPRLGRTVEAGTAEHLLPALPRVQDGGCAGAGH